MLNLLCVATSGFWWVLHINHCNFNFSLNTSHHKSTGNLQHVMLMCWHEMTWYDVTWLWLWLTMTYTETLKHLHLLTTLLLSQNHWFNQLRCKTPHFLSTAPQNTTKLTSLSSQIARDWHPDSSQSRSKSDTINITGLWLLFQRFHDMLSAYQIRWFV